MIVRGAPATEDLQITWTEYQRHMAVYEYGSHRLLMSTYSGYLSPRLLPEQITLLENYYNTNRRRV